MLLLTITASLSVLAQTGASVVEAVGASVEIFAVIDRAPAIPNDWASKSDDDRATETPAPETKAPETAEEAQARVFEELVRDLNRQVRKAMSEGAAEGTTRAERERGGFRGFFRFTAEHPALYRVIRQAEFVSPDLLHQHYARIAEGYVAGLREAMDADEVTRADPEVLAYALMAVGEMVGMRWLLWGDHDQVPEQVFEEMFGFIARGLGIDEGTP